MRSVPIALLSIQLGMQAVELSLVQNRMLITPLRLHPSTYIIPWHHRSAEFLSFLYTLSFCTNRFLPSIESFNNTNLSHSSKLNHAPNPPPPLLPPDPNLRNHPQHNRYQRPKQPLHARMLGPRARIPDFLTGWHGGHSGAESGIDRRCGRECDVYRVAAGF
jgi:hypothetical protein